MHTCQRFLQSSNAPANASAGMAFRTFNDFFFMAFMVTKLVRRIGNFSMGDRKKSHGARSGEYRAWATTLVELLLKNSRKTNDLFARNSGFVEPAVIRRVLYPNARSKSNERSIYKSQGVHLNL